MIFNIIRNREVQTVIFLPVVFLAFWFKTFSTGSIYAFTGTGMPVYELLTNWDFLRNFQWVRTVLSILILLFIFVQLYRINYNYIIFEDKSFAPSFLYLILFSVYQGNQDLNPALLASIPFIHVIFCLFASVRKNYAVSNFFEAAFALSLASLIYFPILYLFPLFIIALIVLRPVIWREWLIWIVGIITPYLLLFSIEYIIFGSISTLSKKLLAALPSQIIINLQIYDWFDAVFLGCFVLIFIVGIFLTVLHSQTKVHIRGFFKVFIWILFISYLIFLTRLHQDVQFWSILSIPACFIVTKMLYSYRKMLVQEAVFSFIILLGILNIYF